MGTTEPVKLIFTVIILQPYSTLCLTHRHHDTVLTDRLQDSNATPSLNYRIGLSILS